MNATRMRETRMHGEIPPQLIEAARNRELSILVGAGVSKAEKAYLQ